MSLKAKTQELAKTVLVFARRADRCAADDGSELTDPGFLILEHLDKVETDSVGDIQEQTKILPAQLSRLLRRLQAARFLASNINRKDRRRIDMTITRKGQTAHETYQNAKLLPIIAALERLTEDERSLLATLFQKMAAE